VLTHYEDRDVVKRAAGNVRATAAVWPHLRAHVALDDPSPVLVTQLWELTLLVGQRSDARQLRQELAGSEVGLPAGTATARELADRIATVDQNLTALDHAIGQRQTPMRQLSTYVRYFVDEQQALARARATICHADQQRGTPVADPATNEPAIWPTRPLPCWPPTATSPKGSHSIHHSRASRSGEEHVQRSANPVRRD
jgi:hypothetical protein